MELNFEGIGQQSRVQIQFDDVGAKLLVTTYAWQQSPLFL
ncbi:DNA helicase II [Aeromonas salmonicida subsp. salmonicida]|uniref:DNA helicase II n=1 Tax=Aeromonas salmonicida subsp. salmonicida 01-B526 TaxID=1076135 RepID=A0ABP2MW25_AERSS|nr:hypothetical protein [Aeromonas salmonicida]ASI21741.1 DNA helicase II [Aeromonas salmonicida]ASI26058.1 DNA helicase II [Aeromonas salmonicida]ASI30176.1 DNA helicase II [Aeromonas salmonicida]ATD37101.1 DNA helicase II [Aeromonas salmonicida subsp. masoucida]AYO65069.1 DNA helicase II [Aeromonas salmonicida subsp. salmonicida 01-B526]